MKIMLDTNVLISAFVFGGQTGNLMKMLFESGQELYVSDYIDQEFKDKLQDKWPQKSEAVYALYHRLDINFCRSTEEIVGQLRDVKDIQVLSDALYYQVDVILTGDKDFLEAELEHPLVYSPAMMLEYLHRIMN